MVESDAIEGEAVGNIDNSVGWLICISDTADGDIVGNSDVIMGNAVGSDTVDGDAVAVPKTSDGSGVCKEGFSSLFDLFCWSSAEVKEIWRRNMYRIYRLIFIILLYL